MILFDNKSLEEVFKITTLLKELSKTVRSLSSATNNREKFSNCQIILKDFPKTISESIK